jgi:hypothetical protein
MARVRIRSDPTEIMLCPRCGLNQRDAPSCLRCGAPSQAPAAVAVFGLSRLAA